MLKMVEYDSVKVKDQLGRPENKNITVKRFKEDSIIEDDGVIISVNTIGNSFIIGHRLNGVIGTANGKNGSQVVIGEAGRSGRIMTVTTNFNKVWRYNFYDSYYEDAANTTADWADTDGLLKFTNTEVAQSIPIAYNDGTISRATITGTVNSGTIASASFQLTADGGDNWESVTHATEHTFTNTGTDLRFKITATGTVDLSQLRVQYS
jgi:hypothetical protein